MPDGDRIHGLAGRYQQPYHQLCQGHHSPAEIARSIVRVVKRDAQHYEHSTRHLLHQMATCLEQLPATPLLASTVDWRSEGLALDQIAQQGRRRAGACRPIDLALKAAKQVLQDIRTSPGTTNIRRALAAAYLRIIYEANFAACLPAPPLTAVAGQLALAAQLAVVQPHVQTELDALAAQLARAGTAAHLRLRRRNMSKPKIDLNTDLLSL